jgi:DNA-binding Lrp family transcriptional regulator
MTERVQLVWGVDYLDAGFTTKPTVITRYAPKLITGKEYVFIDILCSYKHTSDDPFPNQDTIGEHMGITPRSVRNLISSLEDKGYLDIEYIYIDNKRSSAAYNFNKLLDACMKLYRKDQMEKDIANRVKRVRKVKKSVPEENLPVGRTENLPLGNTENLPVGCTQNLPPNKQVNKQDLINNINNQSIVPDDEIGYLIQKIFGNELKADRIDSIYKIYNLFSEDMNLFTYKQILISVQENMHNIKRSFQSYLKSCVEKRLANDQPTKTTKPTRTEMIPEHMKKQDDVKPNTDSLEQVESMIAMIKERLATRPNDNLWLTKLREFEEKRSELSSGKFGF